MIRPPKRDEVTAELAAMHLQRCGVAVTPARIRQWARRGHVKKLRTGHGCYSLRDVESYARARGLIAS